ncbi:MAG: V-type ATP synthase subunit F [Candidatus Hadarchaeales archaeon]
MRQKVGVIGDLETIIGFGLAGVGELYTAGTMEENLANLKKMMEDPEMGIIFVTASVAEELELDRMKKEVFPIVIPIPDSKGRKPKVDLTEKAVTRTLGTKVVIRREE